MSTDKDLESDHADIVNWGGAIARVVETNVRYREDHTTCDVIRECVHCHTHWPER